MGICCKYTVICKGENNSGNKPNITGSFLIFLCEITSMVMVRGRECHLPPNCFAANLGEIKKQLQLHLQMQSHECV